ncbi:hypothetical protein X741_16975 [Mesorhizobium sp. LNHC229A00]|nr:hypothetical protein X741_16975 [Mesorhizobium sp. LNHC229A00]
MDWNTASSIIQVNLTQEQSRKLLEEVASVMSESRRLIERSRRLLSRADSKAILGPSPGLSLSVE